MDLGDILKERHLEWFDMLRSIDSSAVVALPTIVNDGISKLAKDFEKQINDATAAMTESEGSQYAEFASDHHRELSVEYPRLARRGLLMITYAKFEYTMHYLCEAAFLDKKTPTPHPSKVELKRSENFIKNCLGITDQSFEDEWTYANAVRHLRNTFVHSDGHLSTGEKGQAIRAFTEVNPDLHIVLDDNDCVELGENSVVTIAVRFEHFVSILLKRIMQLPEVG